VSLTASDKTVTPLTPPLDGKLYRLIGPDGEAFLSERPGTVGGNRSGLYGRLDCPWALRALRRGSAYRKKRVFFADEATAISAGYRPCAVCMRGAYRIWRAAGNAA
jgi:hypothetical protein